MMTVKNGYIRRGRKDANHGEIQRAFERAGWKVLDISSVGHGCPDLIVYKPHTHFGELMRLVEIKRDGKAKLRPEQVQTIRDGWPVFVVRSVEDVVSLVGGR